MKPFICTMPMRLDDGWNQIQFNLSDFTRRAYGTNYIETLRVQVITIVDMIALTLMVRLWGPSFIVHSQSLACFLHELFGLKDSNIYWFLIISFYGHKIGCFQCPWLYVLFNIILLASFLEFSKCQVELDGETLAN